MKHSFVTQSVTLKPARRVATPCSNSVLGEDLGGPGTTVMHFELTSSAHSVLPANSKCGISPICLKSRQSFVTPGQHFADSSRFSTKTLSSLILSSDISDFNKSQSSETSAGRGLCGSN
jgi:hypothetical protein